MIFNFIYQKLRLSKLFLILPFFYSCVNDLDTIKKVTFKSGAPDDVTENLKIIQTDSGLAKFELSAKLSLCFKDGYARF